ncbi:hypothetical protein SODALDRAFT_321921 [Sodiomyces alkalinus F11]|uniref:F-box domain-containing protein n=1 Tax=Sodiomyces alkalinus (strain CBS 110278 / VKM F-3762 / F11) TaxID=1314773 RepID=A0A3N2Q1M4_SODAK|nr:hypothetical protein SODALDRAFT_321921 [Sodiomyces alkalinus F11]ROT40606.1 hypothetical protein SODALDRAFT_321921 [Sodiomyces alkalinus F11]
MASAATKDKASEAPPRRALNFLDLPSETQHQIFSHCSPGSLICLALVSRHFRDLAAAQIYRYFHIIFPDDDDPDFDSPIDSLASGLETFVASDYDYAQHLRGITLDTTSAGTKGEKAYDAYRYGFSCGKFMNTLLLLTLRKAKSLEIFGWNIRVELSLPVYKALHAISSLKHLHIRLQAGRSLSESPPPLPYGPGSSSLHTSNNLHGVPSLLPASGPTPQPLSTLPPITTSTFDPNVGMLSFTPPVNAAAASSKTLPKNRRKTSVAKTPPTLSGFKKLKTISILDIDDLDCIPEVQGCVKNSALSLQELELSFSVALAQRSRKPTPDLDHDDADLEDEFQLVPMPASGSNWDDAAAPVKAFRAQEERKVQETVLARIFDVEHRPVEKSSTQKSKGNEAVNDVGPSSTSKETPTPAQAFMDRLREVSAKLMTETQEGFEEPDESKRAILELIENAAKKYLESEDAKPGRAGDDKATKESAKSKSSSDATGSSASSLSAVRKQTSPSPDDIDVEEPLASDETEEAADAKAADSRKVGVSSAPSTTTAVTAPIISGRPSSDVTATLERLNTTSKGVVAQLKILDDLIADLHAQLRELASTDECRDEARISVVETRLRGYQKDAEVLQEQLRSAEAEIRDTENSANASATRDGREAQMGDYIRTTRGLQLRYFGVDLIPVKASVLKASVDVHMLESLTLLNVGNQAPIWSMLSRENKLSPLPLRRIFTDNVSMAFLTCVAQLKDVTDLFMLEMVVVHKPASFAPKSAATIDHIRRLVLKKHMPTLKRLLIKNDLNADWDADEKTMMLICNRGRELKELAVSMGVRAMHVFMQQLPGLVNLYALHVVRFRSDDTCPWVVRETHRFLIDMLSHHPELRLEWVCIDDDRVEHIIRGSEQDNKSEAGDKEEGDGAKQKGKGKDKKKHKDKAKSSTGTSGWFGSDNSAYPPLPLNNSWDSASESEDEDEDAKDAARAKLETVSDLRFYDVWDVRIFKKEVLDGRL